MTQRYLATVKHYRVNEKGFSTPVDVQSLFDSVSYTHAETLVNEKQEGNEVEWKLKSLKTVVLNELFLDESDSGRFWKVTAKYRVFDERSGKEKETPFNFLVEAVDMQDAIVITKEKLGTVQDYEITAVTLTKISEVVQDEAE